MDFSELNDYSTEYVYSITLYELDNHLHIYFDNDEITVDMLDDAAHEMDYTYLSDAFPRLTNLELTFRHTSDGPWDYTKIKGFPNLVSLTVDFFTGPKIYDYV